MAQDMMVLPGAKRSTAEWRALVKAYHKRTCTQREFCSAHGVAVSTLDWWRRRLEKTSGSRVVRSKSRPAVAAQPMSFIELPVAPRLRGRRGSSNLSSAKA